MPLQITNTLSSKKETFAPLTPGQVRMYVCGPTVYNFIHIGNARPLVFFDVVRRYLEFGGFQVNYVMNYTDIDDKIIDRARLEKKTCEEITEKYIGEYRRDMELLKIKPPTRMPRVTEHVPQIVHLIEGLIKNGSAYVVEGGEVLFSVRSFATYGKLSKKNLDDLIAGARVEVGVKKRDPMDFALWKPRKEESEPAWPSPWGMGRPGWHIECSVMAMEYLGQTFDIHGGGMDLIHPHHENEIAQSEAYTKEIFARYWMHNNMLNINAEKMSKSLGNILLAREFIERYSAETLKFMLLSGHYRSVIDFSETHLRESQAALHRIYSCVEKCERIAKMAMTGKKPVTTEEQKAGDFGRHFKAKWTEAMDDDFNSARVVGLIFEYVRAMNAFVDRKGFQPTESGLPIVHEFLSNLSELAGVLNIIGESSSAYLGELRRQILVDRKIEESHIHTQIEARMKARKDKDFAAADKIRDELLRQGVELRDSAEATTWDVIFTSPSST